MEQGALQHTAALPDNAFQPASREAWRQWLSFHHGRDAGIWLVSFKKDTGQSCMSYDEAVEEALCFGWIDSKPKTLDAQRSMLWFSPRKTGTGWSAANKKRIERALAAGRGAARIGQGGQGQSRWVLVCLGCRGGPDHP